MTRWRAACGVPWPTEKIKTLIFFRPLSAILPLCTRAPPFDALSVVTPAVPFPFPTMFSTKQKPTANGNAAPGSTPGGTPRKKPLPLSARPIDVFLAFWFVVFAFTTTFTDIHNFTASLKGVRVDELEGMVLAWPPRALTDVYFKWARTVDPLLHANPMFWQ